MMNSIDTYKLVAPDVDRLLNCFNHKYTNPSTPSQEVLHAMAPLFTALKDLAPLAKNNEAKSLWIRVPRGTIDDYDSFEDLLRWGDIETREEYEKCWTEDYPDEMKWYELIIAESSDYRAVGVGRNIIVSADLREDPCEKKWDDEPILTLLPLLTEAANQSMALLRSGEYNDLVSSSLPYQFRTGVVKRTDVWTAEPEMKESIFEGLSDIAYLRFQQLLENQENDEHKIPKLSSMTGNDFLRACAIGYRACGYDTLDSDCNDLPLDELYIRYADGRDEGLTGKGDIMHSQNGGIDLDDPDAWDAWYHHREHLGGHPWEVCRGGNSTHVDLFVRDSRSDIDWKLRLGKIDEATAAKERENGGYFFSVAGNAWNRSVEAVCFYVAIHDAGLPVILRDADAILRRFKGQDLIGIVPRDTATKYCESLFPESYGKILDFMHVYDNDSWRDEIEWLPEEESCLLEMKDHVIEG